MKKIKEVILIDFCSHKETRIVINEGITTIVGESDQGKSVIPKGLNFALNNELFIKNYITVGTKGPAEVTVIFVDDTFVRRTKSKTLNKYEIGFYDDSKNEIVTESLTSFGKEIPDKIKSFVNSRTIELDKDYSMNLNFSHQMDMPFLFNPKQDKESIKAKLINTIADIQEFDIALQSANRKIKNLNLDVKSYDKNIKEKQEELEQYSVVDKKKEILDKIKEKIDKIEANEKLLKEIVDTRNELDVIDTEIEALSEIVSNKSEITKMEEILSKIESNLTKEVVLNNTLNEIISINKEIKLIDDEIIKCNNVMKCKVTIDLMESKIDKALMLADKVSIKEERLELITECTKEVKRLDNEIAEVQLVLSQKHIVDRQYEIIETLITKNDLLTRKETTLVEIQGVNKEIKHIDEEIVSLNKVIIKKPLIDKMESNINLAIDKLQRVQMLELEKQEIDELTARIQKGTLLIDNEKKEYDKLKEEYIAGLRDFGKCPLCMSKLTEEHLEEVLQEL